MKNMKNLLIAWGNFFFHTRNVLFPVIIVGLLLLWSPVAMDSTASICLLLIGLAMIIIGQCIRILTIGLAYIVRGGRNRRVYAEKLVTDGFFAHCRNPLYAGNILIVSGFLFISGNVSGIIIGSLIFFAIYRLIVHSEEAFLEHKFGQDYRDFCASVPRWIPRLTGLGKTITDYEFDWPAVAVKEYGTLFTSLIIPLGLISWKLHLVNKADDYQFLLSAVALLILIAYGVVRFLKKTERLKSLR
ncbi:putative S-isoprenylcysteine methyltransferase-like protein [Crenothrix polyspora]|uniref:Putative S-isoprenylcysteine methyltransferase-like protein n=1 Tax=Crenothrix polyspora TaxID=360316 RepID=A0A1R4HIG8_9GAMM|nr:isoprenylcysteine carboxylmethyltransferase family protein [Crenothrix polyspora]SJM95801.1 putative S-isoprenylcysteine methyltransferase-like protein [Crenothrix polyspora]